MDSASQLDYSNGNGSSGQSARGNRKETLRFAELWHILKLKKVYPITFAIITLLGIMIGRFTHIPVYTARATLQLLEAKENSTLSQVTGSDLFSNRDPNQGYEQLMKYVNYLRSSTFHLVLAESLKFRPEYQKLNLTRPKELNIFKRKFWNHFYLTRFGGQKSTDYHDESLEPVLIPVENLAGMLGALLMIDNDGERFIHISSTTLDPYTSMVISNAAAEVFHNTMREHDQNEISEIQQFVADRIKETGDRLKHDELELVNFKQRNNIISNIDTNLSATRLGSIDNELASSRMKYKENERLIVFYEQKLADRQKALVNGEAVVVDPGQSLGMLRQQLEDLRRQKFLMSSQGYGDGHWRTTELDKAITEVSKALQIKSQGGAEEKSADERLDSGSLQTKLETLKSANDALKSKISATEKVRAELVQSMSSMPADEQKLINLSNNVKLAYELYSNLKKRIQEIEIQRIALKARIKVEQMSGMPGPAPQPSFFAQLVFAIAAGLFFGCIIVVVMELLDTSIKHRSDLEECELGVLGTIPHIETKTSNLLGPESYRPDLLICETQPESAEAMSFKYIRAQLGTMRGYDGKPAQAITITSADRGEGKSFIASNIAVSLSQLEKKVILLDCDFRNPSVHKYLGIDNGDGLTSLLTMNASLQDVLITNKFPNLDVITCGWPTPSPTELICNDKFRVLIKFLKTKYDYVIIDAPPATFVVDAPVIGSISDGVILVASYRKTSKDALLMAYKKILQISHKRVYSILTNVTEIHEFTTYYANPYVAATSGKKAPYGNGMNSQDKATKDELSRFEENLGKKKSA